MNLYKGNLMAGWKPSFQSSMKMSFITLFRQYDMGISVCCYWKHKQTARTVIMQTVFLSFSSKELKVNPSLVFPPSFYRWQNKQYIATWFCSIKKEIKKKKTTELELSELQSRTNLYSDPVSSFYSAIVQDSQQSQQNLHMQKNGKVKLTFITCCLCVYRLSAVIEKFNTLPGSLPWHPEPDRDAILATAQGGLCIPWVRVWHKVQLNLEMPFRFYLSFHWSL